MRSSCSARIGTAIPVAPASGVTDVRLRRDKYSDIATPQLLPVFIEVYAEGLVAAHKAAQLRPAAAAAAGGGGEEAGGEEEVDLDAFVEAPEIDMDDL